jgi:hypothetical protein
MILFPDSRRPTFVPIAAFSFSSRQVSSSNIVNSRSIAVLNLEVIPSLDKESSLYGHSRTSVAVTDTSVPTSRRESLGRKFDKAELSHQSTQTARARKSLGSSV